MPLSRQSFRNPIIANVMGFLVVVTSVSMHRCRRTTERRDVIAGGINTADSNASMIAYGIDAIVLEWLRRCITRMDPHIQCPWPTKLTF